MGISIGILYKLSKFMDKKSLHNLKTVHIIWPTPNHSYVLSYFLLPLDQLILNRIGIFIFNIYISLLPQVINTLYIGNTYINTYNNRGSNLLRVPTCSMNFVNISTGL